MHFRAFTGYLRHVQQRPTTSAVAFPGSPTFCQFWDRTYCFFLNTVPVSACNIDVNLVNGVQAPGQQSGLRSNFTFAHSHGTTYHCFSSASQWSMRRSYVFNAFIICAFAFLRRLLTSSATYKSSFSTLWFFSWGGVLCDV